MIALQDKIMVDMYYQAQKANIIQTKMGRLLLVFFVVSTFDGINFSMIILWLNSLIMRLGFPGIYYDIGIDFFPGNMLNSAIEGLILFYLPFLILRFFALFYKKRYNKLLEKYEYRNGKFLLAYMLITVGVLIIPMVLMSLLF